MKRCTPIVLIAIFYTQLLYAQKENTNTPINVSGFIQVTNNGIAPAPIFALGRPAIIGSALIKKGKFYFNPEFYFGLDAKPWIFNTRLGYNFIDNKNLTLGLAINPNFFFLQRNPVLNNDEQFQLQRYVANELNGEYRITYNRKIQLNFWRSFRLDQVGVKREEFLNLVFAMENLKLGANALIAFRPSVFYLYDAEALEGFFASQTSNFQMTNWKFNFFLQTSIPIVVTPKNSFIWNFGVNVPF